MDASNTLVSVTADHSHSFLISGYASRHNSLFGKQIFVIFLVTRPLLAVFGLSVNVCAVINNVWSLLKSGGNSVPCHGI